jgi:hypothetical protein
MSSAAVSAVTRSPSYVPDSPASLVPGATFREMWLMAFGSLALLVAEVFSNNPRILFGRYLSIDELLAKLIESKPSVWQSLRALEHSGDFTPPTYHILARASWRLLGGSAETAFRTLSFVSIWIALVLTYALLRRSFAVLPALVTVLAFWSNPLVIQYTFYARCYAPLITATAGFCLIYGQDKKGPFASAVTAAMAALVCTLHYFGIFAVAAVVLGDTLARREPLPSIMRRWLPVAAGPIALAACLPFVIAFNTGHLPSCAPPTLRALWSWLLGGPVVATGVLVVAWCISIIASLPIHLFRRGGLESQPTRVGPLQPVAGLFGLVLVPMFILIFSLLAYSATNVRYMLPGLLGLTSLLALVAAKISPRILAGAAMLLALLGAHNLRLYSDEQMRWQADKEQMINVGRLDRLPIVTFNMHEAYLLYDYSPSLRDRVFIADLSQTHKVRVSSCLLLDTDLAKKWSTVNPDLPKLIDLDQLRRLGKFHLLSSEAVILAGQEFKRKSLFSSPEKIANALSFQKVGDLYEMQPN